MTKMRNRTEENPWSVIATQLAKWSPPTAVVPSLNLVIS